MLIYQQLENGFVRNLDTGEEMPDIAQPYLDWIASGGIPAGQSLAETQAVRIEEIEGNYLTAITANIDYMGAVFQSDYPTHDNIKSVLSCGSVPDGFGWFDINNQLVPMTYQQLQGLSRELVFRGFVAFAKKQALKAQVRAATDGQRVRAIKW